MKGEGNMDQLIRFNTGGTAGVRFGTGDAGFFQEKQSCVLTRFRAEIDATDASAPQCPAVAPVAS
jgi:hypothetical protein